MREQPTEVSLVYQYLYWDQDAGTRKVSKGFATFDAIKDGLGVPLYASGKLVAASEVVGGIWQEKSSRPPAAP